MSSTEIFSQLRCGLTNDHIVKNPIHLNCGHCICKSCIGAENIECKICGQSSYQNELRIQNESIPIKNLIKIYLSGLLEDLEKRASVEIRKFKSEISFIIVHKYTVMTNLGLLVSWYIPGTFK